MTSRRPPGRRCAGASAQRRSSRTRPSRPASQRARAPARGERAVGAGHVGRVGDDRVEALVADRLERLPRSARDADAVEPRVSADGQDARGGRRRPPSRSRAPRRAARDGERAAAGAEVEHRRAPGGSGLARAGRRRASSESRSGRNDARAARAERTHARLPAVLRATNRATPRPPRAARGLRRRRRRRTVGLEEELMLLDPETLDLRPADAEVLARARGRPALQARDARGAARDRDRAARAPSPPRRPELAKARARPEAAAAARLARSPAPARTRSRRPTGRSTPARATTRSRARVRLDRAPPARLRPARPRRRRAAPTARSPSTTPLRSQLPAARRARGQRAVLRGRRHAAWPRCARSICDLLPRQGVPPALASLEALADALRWGAAAASTIRAAGGGSCGCTRPTARVEVRVPDAQTTVGDTAAVGAVVHALVGGAGRRATTPASRSPVADAWRIDENRWSACRHGLEGDDGRPRHRRRRPTRERLPGCSTRSAPRRAPGCAGRRRATRQRAVAADARRAPCGWLARLADACVSRAVARGRPGR